MRKKKSQDIIIEVESKKLEDNQQEETSKGFFSFLFNDLKQENETTNVFSKLGNSIKRYKENKEKEVEKLHIYESIAKAAHLNREFLVLLLGSCLIATFGLFQGSTAVIIGAMLIAPLMMPILGFALGTIWGDQKLIWRSVFTLLTGSTLVLIISILLTILIPGVEMNAEINARINPNLFDIMVALASGLVGAYAYVNPNISSSISGVAIAVALMPPLCTIGIALGLSDIRAAFGAALLYATNLVGITLAASFIFWRLKVHPSKEKEDDVSGRAKKNVYVAAFFLLLIAIPLGFFMYESFYLKHKKSDVRTLIRKTIPKANVLSLVVTKAGKKFLVKSVIITPSKTKQKDFDKLQVQIAQLFHGNIEISLTPIVQREFNDNALDSAIKKILKEKEKLRQLEIEKENKKSLKK